MHAARADKSPRLQRILRVLRDGKPHSTWEIQIRARSCCVSTCIAELRANGVRIDIELRVDEELGRVWFYTMKEVANG